MSNQTPSCPKCKHFYITWDRRFPNGCKLYGIKSKYPPSLEVLRATGKTCLVFERKLPGLLD
ncbi:hypothetical protein Dred_0592 [Desulforamulus reducens MI-1]|uniref:Uracil-DNA glycosylase n=1 Tax=Desulforamulus reducens (strain ATCC BAA-1160 / DSM 100696 / MI-1) TaxID=349161 RepID=A4J231_DESRM|nr:hypothetical protein Dred_0592 [Desulforamulus reducens MI-1]